MQGSVPETMDMQRHASSNREGGLWTRRSGFRFKHKQAIVSATVIILLIAMAIFADTLAPYAYDAIDLPSQSQPPSWQHWFGTDALGRDLFSRVVHGSRISLGIAASAGLVVLVTGVLYGSLAGCVGGRVDGFMMAFTDLFHSVPFVLIVVILMMFFERDITLIFLCIGLVSWMNVAKVTRGQILVVKNHDYIRAAQLAGASFWRILFRHLLPNAMGPILVQVTLTVPALLQEEAFLSFIGLGVQAPMVSWGALAAEGQTEITMQPWLILFPGFALAITVLAFNALGEAAGDALVPGASNRR